jgi:hypothetical protein
MNQDAIIIAAAAIAGPKLRELKDTPAFRFTISEAIRTAEFIAKIVESHCAERKLIAEQHGTVPK